MLNIDTHICSTYSTFSSQQPPVSSARVPATHRGRVLHFITSYTFPETVTNLLHGSPAAGEWI
jgi:hypothetical protein